MTGVIHITPPMYAIQTHTLSSHRSPLRGVPPVLPHICSIDLYGSTYPEWRTRTCTICLHQLNTNHAPLSHRWKTVHSMANIEILLNSLLVSPINRPMRIFHPVIIHLETSLSVVTVFLSPACDQLSSSPQPLDWGLCLEYWHLVEGVYIYRRLSSRPSYILLQRHLLVSFVPGAFFAPLSVHLNPPTLLVQNLSERPPWTHLHPGGSGIPPVGN